MKIAIVTDSSSGLSKEEAKKHGIYLLPLQVSINDKAELEGETIDVNTVYQHVANDENVKTSLPPMGLIEDLFKELKKDYDMIFAIPICHGLSSTITTMQMIAKQVDIAFESLDCYATFFIERYLALKARVLLDSGKAFEEVKRILEDSAAHSDTMIIPDDLKYLARSGRITHGVALLGGLLKIKPILHLDKSTSGKIDTVDKVRTMKKAIKCCIDKMKEKGVDESYTIMCGHIFDEETGKLGYEMMKEAFPNIEMGFEQISSVVGVHTGVGCIGFQYIKRISE